MTNLTQPIEIILRFNAGIINAFQSATVSWMRRRHEAARDTAESFEKLAHCHDIGEAVTIQREWVRRSLNRLDQDFSPLATQTSDMLHEASSAGENLVASMPEVAQSPRRKVEDHVGAVKHTRPKVRSTKIEGPNHRTKPDKSRAKGRRR